MRIATIKSVIWFLIIMLIAFAFPLQVLLLSPLPSLFPYLLVMLILILDVFTGSRFFSWNIKKPLDLFITIYVILVLFQTSWQTIFGFVSLDACIRAIVIYLLPVFFYIYFRNGLTEKEIRSILFSVALCGLIIGCYFYYESILKLFLGQLTEYSIKAHEYTIAVSDLSLEEANPARIGVNYRGMGLLEKHAASAAWIIFGCFAALSLLPRRAIFKRVVVLSIYGTMILFGLNFTGIFGFTLLVFLIEFDGYYVLHGIIYRKNILKLIFAFSIVMLILIVNFFLLSFESIEIIQRIFTTQFDIISGNITLRDDNLSFFEGFLHELFAYHENIYKFPLAIILGQGFAKGFAVYSIGGDYGFVETLHTFGLPLFISITFGLISLILKAIHQIFYFDKINENYSRYMKFALSISIYILFSEIHYSIWRMKSVLPILFIAMSIFSYYSFKRVPDETEKT